MTELKKIASFALDETMALCADACMCTVRRSEKREFNMEGSEFTLLRSVIGNDLALSAIKDHRHGSLHVNSLDEETVRGAAKQVMDVTLSGEADEAWEFAKETENVNEVQGQPEGDMEAFFSRVRELAKDIREMFPRVSVESLVAQHNRCEIVSVNSYGVCHELKRGEYSVGVQFAGREGDATGSFNASGFTTLDLSKPFIEQASLKKDLEDAEKQIHPQPMDGKFVGVAVFPPDAFASMLYTAIGNFTGDGAILNGSSIWKDKLGEKVADERLTISMNPFDPRIVCGERWTGDGFASEDFDLIRDGVLNSFMIGLYTSNKTGKARAKNSSWSMIVKNGEKSLDEIVSGIERGIVVGRFSGGEPGANGDFSGVAKNSFLIENGKITKALSETMINGNLAQMLLNLVDLSRETVEDGSMVLPYAAFSGITVSGK